MTIVALALAPREIIMNHFRFAQRLSGLRSKAPENRDQQAQALVHQLQIRSLRPSEFGLGQRRDKPLYARCLERR